MPIDKDKPSIRLTRNDKYVLKQLISHGRISDSATAEKIGVTPQAVLKSEINSKRRG